jgi:AcrR family transcriptional regulator
MSKRSQADALPQVASPTSKQQRTAVAQRRMIDAALDMIAEGGMAQVALTRIGERAGYSRGLADYHFNSKAELVEKVVQGVAGRWADRLRRFVPRGTRGLSAIAGVIEGYMIQLEEDPRDARVMHVLRSESITVDSEIHRILADHDSAFREMLARYVRQAKQDGTVRADVEPFDASVLLEGLIRGIAHQWVITPAAFDPKSMTPMLLDAVVGALGRPAGLLLGPRPEAAGITAV